MFAPANYSAMSLITSPAIPLGTPLALMISILFASTFFNKYKNLILRILSLAIGS